MELFNSFMYILALVFFLPFLWFGIKLAKRQLDTLGFNHLVNRVQWFIWEMRVKHSNKN